jgi:DNA repair exonuclease SbcCD nuclease subunit
MRVVHAADIHLDSPLRGLSRLGDDQVAAQVRQASRHAMRNLVDLVVRERAAALVLAGDIYDGDWPDYATGRFFAEQLDKLHDEGIPVFMAAGNHDAESQITKTLTLPPNVTVLSTEHPETVVNDDLGLAVHGQGFPTRAVIDNLVLSYPERRPGLVNIGILHTAVNGAEGHDNYAPCTPEDLMRSEYDYFALGHVHEHRIVNDGHRVAAFSGNLQGRHPRETGAKGALVVDVEPDEQAQVRLVPLDVARWARVEVDVTGVRSVEDALERADRELGAARTAAQDRLLVARVVLTGGSAVAAELADWERLQMEVGRIAVKRGVTLERAVSQATTLDSRAAVDPELILAVGQAGERLATDHGRLRELTKSLDSEVGRHLRAGNGLNLSDPATLRRLSQHAVSELTAILSSGDY